MLLASLLCLVQACSSIHVAARQGVNLPPLDLPVTSLSYPSGLRVLVERDTRTELAGVFLVVGSGSSADPAGREGLAHYVEHLTFRSRPGGAEPLADLLDRSGALQKNGVTSLDYTVYYEVGLAAQLPDLLRLEGARMRAPVSQVSAAVRATELEVVKNERRLRNETGFVGEVLGDLQAALFPREHPYSRSTIGSTGSLSSITDGDVEAFVKAHYRPDNLTLLVLGNVDLETVGQLIGDTLPLELLATDQVLHPLKRMPPTAPRVPDSPAAPATLERREAPVSAPELWVGWSLPRGFDTDAYLLDFVSRAVAGELRYALRNDEDVAQVSAERLPGLEASMVLCRIALYKGEHPEQSLKTALDRLTRLWASSGDEVADARQETRFWAARRMAFVGQVSGAQDLIERGLARATISHFSDDPSVYSRMARELSQLRLRKLATYSGYYLTKARARAILFVAPASGATAAPLLAESSGERPQVTESSADVLRSVLEAKDPAWAEARLRALLPPAPGRRVLKLENGLRVVLEPRAGVPIINVGLVMPSAPTSQREVLGAEIARRAGWASWMKNGAPEEFGGVVLESVGSEGALFEIEGPSGNADNLIATLAEVVRLYEVNWSAWLDIRVKSLPIARRSEREPAAVAARAFYKALLAGSQLGESVVAAQLEDASQSLANDWISANFRPSRVTLTIAGDFDPEAMVRLVHLSFASWKGDLKEQPVPPLPTTATSTFEAPAATFAQRPLVSQESIRFGCVWPGMTGSDMEARYEVAARVLQERLGRSLREKMAATYGVWAGTRAAPGGTAWLEVQAAIETAKLAPALGVLKQTLASLAASPPQPHELAWAKLRRAGSLALGRMTNQGLVRAELSRAQLGWPADGPGPADDLAAVTGPQVQADFGACLAKNPTLAIVGDEQAARAALREGWK